MDTAKYQIFLKVLECRNFSQAAAELGYTQAAVSHSVAALEKHFGFRLLNRKNGDVSLTRAGVDILPHIRNVVNAQDMLDLSLQSYRTLDSGTLCIATIPSLAIHYFPSLLERFHERYPNIHIICIDGNYEEIEEMLAGGRVDFGFTSVSPSMSFEQTVLFRERLMLVLPLDHPLNQKEHISLQDLENVDFIMPGEGPNHQVGELIREYDLHLKAPYSATDDNLTVKMVSQHLGVSILPEMSFRGYLNFSIAARELEERPYRDVGIIYTRWESVSPLSRVFVKTAREYFQELTATSPLAPSNTVRLENREGNRAL